MILRRPWSSPVVWLVAILCFVATIYAHGINGGWIFDDYPNIVDNAGVQIQGWTLPDLARATLSSPASDFKRPLASLSFAMNYLATGMDPAAMKATNVAIHLANGALLYALLASLLAFVHGRSRSEVSVTALFASAAWLLLPINLTAVLYVVQRMESMANLVVFAGLLGYITGRRRMLAGHRGFAIATMSILAATVVGAMAKETAILLPLYAALLEVYFFKARRVVGDARMDRRIVAFYVLVLALPFIAGCAWLIPQIVNPQSWARRDFTLGTRLLSEARIVVDYAAWTIVPWPSWLSFYHDDFMASTGLLTPWTTLPCILAIGAATWLAWALRRRAPWLGLGLAWYLACHTLTATVLPLELIYEHRNYFASVGIVMLVVGAFRGELGKARALPPRLATARNTGLVIVLGIWTFALASTVSAWNDPLSLARLLADRGPESPRAQYELGREYIILSRYNTESPYAALVYAPLERAMRIPGSSVLPEQALIFFNGRMGRPIRDEWWDSMRGKLAARPPTIQDESSLDALSKCLQSEACHFPAPALQSAFLAAMAHPQPSGRLLAMYADFVWTTLGDQTLALSIQERAVKATSGEPAYRISLARMLIVQGRPGDAETQIGFIQAANIGGRFNDDLSRLRRQLAGTREEGAAK
ncbi:MAG: hypothetical protein WBW32_04690 [Luteibacter sp.]